MFAHKRIVQCGHLVLVLDMNVASMLQELLHNGQAATVARPMQKNTDEGKAENERSSVAVMLVDVFWVRLDELLHLLLVLLAHVGKHVIPLLPVLLIATIKRK